MQKNDYFIVSFSLSLALSVVTGCTGAAEILPTATATTSPTPTSTRTPVYPPLSILSYEPDYLLLSLGPTYTPLPTKTPGPTRIWTPIRTPTSTRAPTLTPVNAPTYTSTAAAIPTSATSTHLPSATSSPPQVDQINASFVTLIYYLENRAQVQIDSSQILVLVESNQMPLVYTLLAFSNDESQIYWLQNAGTGELSADPFFPVFTRAIDSTELTFKVIDLPPEVSPADLSARWSDSNQPVIQAIVDSLPAYYFDPSLGGFLSLGPYTSDPNDMSTWPEQYREYFLDPANPSPVISDAEFDSFLQQARKTYLWRRGVDNALEMSTDNLFWAMVEHQALAQKRLILSPDEIRAILGDRTPIHDDWIAWDSSIEAVFRYGIWANWSFGGGSSDNENANYLRSIWGKPVVFWGIPPSGEVYGDFVGLVELPADSGEAVLLRLKYPKDESLRLALRHCLPDCPEVRTSDLETSVMIFQIVQEPLTIYEGDTDCFINPGRITTSCMDVPILVQTEYDVHSKYTSLQFLPYSDESILRGLLNWPSYGVLAWDMWEVYPACVPEYDIWGICQHTIYRIFHPTTGLPILRQITVHSPESFQNPP